MKIIFWLLLISGLTIFSILIANTILPFFIAFTLAYILEPLIDNLYTKYKFPRPIIVYTILIIFLSSVIILLTLVLPLLYHQIALLIGKIPVYKTYLQTELIPQLTNKLHTIDPTIADKIQSSSQTFINNTMSMLGKIVNNIWEYTMATINVLVLLFLVPIILLYLLRDWPKIIKHLEGLLPLAKKEQINILLSNINQLLSAYVRGQLNICFLLAAFYCIGLSIIGIDFGLLLGIISGVLIIVPIIGTVISIAIAIAIGYFTFGCTIKIVYIIALYVVGHIMESYIMTPKIIGSKIGLHPLWIIFSVFASGNLFGFIGIFFAIPIAGIIKVLLCYAIDVYKSSAIYKSQLLLIYHLNYMNKLIKNEIIKIADIHKQRIIYAREKLSNLIPFTAEKIQNLSEEEFLVIELMVNRFSKLQDYIGSKVIDLFFETANENYKNLTMLDKLHRLEKFNIIENKDIWQAIRELRNNLAHEYPEHPELTALFLNQTYYFSQELIRIYYKLQEYIMKE